MSYQGSGPREAEAKFLKVVKIRINSAGEFALRPLSFLLLKNNLNRVSCIQDSSVAGLDI